MKIRWLLPLLVFWLMMEGYRTLRPSIPAFIRVDDQIYKVYVNNKAPLDLDNEALLDETEKIYGETVCSPDSDRESYIQINPNQDFSEMQDTLWHEAHHAANKCEKEAESTHFDDIYDYQIPEEIKLMKQNPDLVRYITARGLPWNK